MPKPYSLAHSRPLLTRGRTRQEYFLSTAWTDLFRELAIRNSPLQMWLLLDQLIAERAKRRGIR